MHQAETKPGVAEPVPADTIPALLEFHARCSPDAVALLAPQRPPLTYAALWRQVQEVGDQLRAWGIGRGDRVALMVPDGPEMALAFLSVTSTATTAPLSCSLPAAELTACLSTLGARAMIVSDSIDSAAATAARDLGLSVITLTPLDTAEAGLFTLAGCPSAPRQGSAGVTADDLALLVCTSGTTARPKIVPLTHRQMLAVSGSAVHSWHYTAADRCLMTLPMTYSFSLGVIVTSVMVGGSVLCAPGFRLPEVLDWLATCRPTYLPLVPTMLDGIMDRLAHDPGALAHHALRLINIGAAALSPRAVAAAEAAFHVPVVVTYGTTEVGVVATTALSLQGRRPGSVGKPVGQQEVAIMDSTGHRLAPGQVGEVVARGPSVMAGYLDDPEATAQAFWEGWFRTGDAGYLDEEGYLFITGRFKEMINRGGQKVAPGEVEDILLDHPAVAQAAVFALPHPSLGEDVAAAIVPRAGSTATEVQLRAFVGERLAAFKVPRRVVFVAGLPTGPTGKVQRLGLAQHLRLTGLEVPPYLAPRDQREAELAALWAIVLGVERVGVHDDFFALGGQSLQAARLFDAIAQRWGHRLPLSTLFAAGTVADLALHLHLLEQPGAPAVASPLVAIQPLGHQPPLICVPPLDNNMLCYREVARLLGPEHPVYGLPVRTADPRRPDEIVPHQCLEDLAQEYVRAIQAMQPTGPYALAGYSAGGVIAYELARQLQAQGQAVRLLVLFDAPLPDSSSWSRTVWPARHTLWERVRLQAAILHFAHPGDRLPHLTRLGARLWHRCLRRAASTGAAAPLSTPAEVHGHHLQSYVPQGYSGPILLFWAIHNKTMAHYPTGDPRRGWRRLAGSTVEIYGVPGDHAMHLQEPAIARRVAEKLRTGLERAPSSR